MRRKYKQLVVCFGILVAIISAASVISPSKTDAAINPQINFQGKLANPDGTNVTDGTYSIVFSIYTVSSGGSNVWTETEPSVNVASGIFQVSLGSVTSLPGSVDFNTSALYLGVKVGSDAEMTPRVQLTAAPYAFNASQVGGITASSLVQLNPGSQQSGAVNISGSLTAAGGLNINSGATVPTTDQVVVDNTSSTGVTTAFVNGVNVKYKGGAAAVEGSGLRVDYTPGSTSGGTWSGIHVVQTSGAGSGINGYGLKLEGTGGAGNDYGIEVASGWDIGIDVQSGGLQLAGQAEPTVPAANNLKIYAKDIAGRIIPKWVGPAGVDTPFQANLGFNRVEWAEPSGISTNCGTGISIIGGSATGSANGAAANCVNPTLTTTNLLTSIRRMQYPTGTTAGTMAYQRQSALQFWRGNAAGRGGFFYTSRFGTSTVASGNRMFIGMSDSIANPTNIDPTTSTTYGKLGLAINASTGNWNFINNISGTAPTVAALGASFPVNTTDLYELVMFSAPNGTSIGYRVTDITSGTQTSGSVSTNIPNTTTFLSPVFWATNNASAVSATIDWAGWYVESDN